MHADAGCAVADSCAYTCGLPSGFREVGGRRGAGRCRRSSVAHRGGAGARPAGGGNALSCRGAESRGRHAPGNDLRRAPSLLLLLRRRAAGICSVSLTPSCSHCFCRPAGRAGESGRCQASDGLCALRPACMPGSAARRGEHRRQQQGRRQGSRRTPGTQWQRPSGGASSGVCAVRRVIKDESIVWALACSSTASASRARCSRPAGPFLADSPQSLCRTVECGTTCAALCWHCAPRWFTLMACCTELLSAMCQASGCALHRCMAGQFVYNQQANSCALACFYAGGPSN